ncbi:MAG: transglycosylase SLT domain-containing protein [Myxococcales bacterium]|nr:transglycosylase SLT domain-containing protein [Myxococcales bacterium]
MRKDLFFSIFFLMCFLPWKALAGEGECGAQDYRLRVTRHPLSSFTASERKRMWQDLRGGMLVGWKKKLLHEKASTKTRKRIEEAADQWRALGFLKESASLYQRLAVRYGRAQGLFFLAKDALREKDYKKAEKWLTRLEKASGKQRAWWLPSLLLWARWGTHEASSAWLYQLYQKSQGQTQETRGFFLRVWVQKLLQETKRQKDKEKVLGAIRRLQDVLKKSSKDRYLRDAYARILMYGGKNERKKGCRLHQKQKKAGARWLFHSAKCFEILEDPKKASSVYLSILRRWPGSSYAERARRKLAKQKRRHGIAWYLLLAKHHHRRMEYDKAEAALRHLEGWVKKQPKSSAKVRYLWSQNAFRQKDYTRCMQFFTPRKDPKVYARSALLRARYLLWTRCLYRQKKRVEDIRHYEAIAAIAPKSKEGRQALWWAAQLYAEQDREEDAQRLFLRYIQRFQGSARAKEAQFKLGLVAYKKKAYKKAVVAFRRLLSLGRAEAAKGWFWIGKSYEKMGEKKQATGAFRRAVQKGHGYYSIEAAKKLGDQKRGVDSPIDLIWHDREEEKELSQVLRWSKIHGKGMRRLCRKIEKDKGFREASLFLLTGWEHAFMRKMRDVRKQLPGAAGAYLMTRAWRFFGRADQVIKEGGRVRVLMKPKEKKGFPAEAKMRMLFPVAYPGLYLLYGKRYGLPALFMMGLTRQESLFSPTIVSGAGARGIAQMMPKDAARIAKKWKMKRYALGDLFRPEINLRMGFSHFRDYLERHKGQKDLTLAAYNAGPHSLKRWMKESPGLADRDRAAFLAYGIGYRETRRYVPSCLRWYRTYRFYLRPSKVY